MSVAASATKWHGMATTSAMNAVTKGIIVLANCIAAAAAAAAAAVLGMCCAVLNLQRSC